MSVTTDIDATSEPKPSPAGSDPRSSAPADGQNGLVSEDLLVEDVSIDGMCGVY
jgi:mycofactocin precursor